jgi:hypothetical protein
MSIPVEKLRGKGCDRAGCFGAARFVPVLLIYAPKSAPNSDSPAKAEIALKICEPCSKRLRVSDVLDSGTWKAICAGLERRGLRAPDVSRTVLTFRAIYENLS